MTISSEIRKAGPYIGNDVTTSFPFAFKVFSASDVVVILTDPAGVETTLNNGADYSVTLNADQDTAPGGSVEKTSALATGYKLTITSSVPNLQPLDLTNQGGFYPKVINAALDRLTILAQQLAEKVSRSVKVQISSNTSPDQIINNLFQASFNAASSATAAANSATNAAASATSAANSASNAANSASAAQAAVNSLGLPLAIASGGTGATTASAALTNLGVSDFAKTLLDDPDAATARATLGATALGGALFTATDAATARQTLDMIVTTAEAQGWTNNTKAISPLRLVEALKGGNQSLSSSGFQRLPGGLIIQWGYSTTSGGGTTVTFPFAFPNSCLTVVASVNAANNNRLVSTGNINTTTFPAYVFQANTGANTDATFNWIAIGY
jgi:hypothetical protein